MLLVLRVYKAIRFIPEQVDWPRRTEVGSEWYGRLYSVFTIGLCC